MRRFLTSLSALGLLGTAIGCCHCVTGICDCVGQGDHCSIGYGPGFDKMPHGFPVEGTARYRAAPAHRPAAEVITVMPRGEEIRPSVETEY